MTCGMSDELLKSDLLSRISVLSLNDKQCLIRYISEEVEADQMGEEDPWETQDTTDLEPYTLEELYARIEESEKDIREGRVLTAEEAREELRKEFPWLTMTCGMSDELLQSDLLSRISVLSLNDKLCLIHYLTKFTAIT